MTKAFGQHAASLRARANEYGPKARRQISAGACYSAAEYYLASQLRAAWIDELSIAFAVARRAGDSIAARSDPAQSAVAEGTAGYLVGNETVQSLWQPGHDDAVWLRRLRLPIGSNRSSPLR